MRISVVTMVLAAILIASVSCADTFPGDKISTPRHCTEISVPVSLKDSFLDGMEPGQPAMFRAYSTEDTFAAVDSAIAAQIKPLGYKLDPKLFIRRTDQGNEANAYFVAYSKRGGKYFVAVADLADLRSRGEQIEGTADYLVVCGVKKKQKKQKAAPGDKVDKDSPGYVEL